MTQTYIGTKIVAAWPQEKGGEPGYSVRYDDGYESWSPKAVFERSYRPMTDAEAEVMKSYGTGHSDSPPAG